MYTCTRTHAHTHTVTYTHTHCFQRCKFGNQHATKCHLKIPPRCHGHEWELFFHKTLLMMLFPQREPCKIGLFGSHAQFSDPIIQIEFGSQSQTLDLNAPKLECTAFLPLVGICLLPSPPFVALMTEQAHSTMKTSSNCHSTTSSHAICPSEQLVTQCPQRPLRNQHVIQSVARGLKQLLLKLCHTFQALM